MFIQQQSHDEKLTSARHRIAGLAVLLAVLLAVFPQRTRAQEDTPRPSGQDSSPNSSSSTSQDSGQEPLPDQSTTSTLEPGQTTGQNNRVVPLRWGHLSMFAVDGFFVYDSNYQNSPYDPQASTGFAGRIIADYSVGNERTGLDIQYRPDVLISPVNHDYQFAASLVNFHLLRPISESWTFTLHDTFTYEPDFSLLDNPIASLSSTGGIIQQSLLLNGTTALQNILSGAFTYRLARNDHLTFNLQDNYTELNNNPGSVKSSAIFYGSSDTAGAGVSWTHSLGPDHEFGVAYNYDRAIFSGYGSQAQYHTILGTYTQRIRRSLTLQLYGGPSFYVYSNGTPYRTTFVGSAGVVKTFRQSTLVGNYSRGYYFTGIITNSYTNRYEAFYSRVFQNTWGFQLGGAYLQSQSTLLTGQLEERVAFARVNYNLNWQWTLFASVMNSAFAGVAQPYVGRNFVTIGARWSYGGQREMQP